MQLEALAHLQALLSSMQPSNLHGSFNDGLQVELSRHQDHLVSLNASEIKNVSDESQQSLPRAPDGIHQVPLRWGQHCLCAAGPVSVARERTALTVLQ